MAKYIQLLLLACLTVIPSVSEQWYQVGNPHFLNTQSVFPAIKQQNAIKILKFFSPWCKYCRFIKNYVDQYKSKNQISSNLKFYEFDCHGNGPMFCYEHFQVRAYPAVLMINEKGETLSRIDGLYPQDVINNILTQYNNKAKAILQKLAKQNQPSKQEVKKEQNQEQNRENKQEKKQQNKNEQQEQKKTEGEKSEDIKKVQNNQQQNTKDKQIKQEQKQQKKQVVEEQKKQPQEEHKKEQVKEDKKSQVVEKKVEDKKVDQVAPKKQEQKKQPVVQKQQKQEKEVPRKIQKQMVQQRDVQNIARPHPENPKLEQQAFATKDKDKKQQDSSFIKYFLYLTGISIGVLYGIKIFTSKQQQAQAAKRLLEKQQQEGSQQNTKPASKLTARDIQNQILVEEVPDQNL